MPTQNEVVTRADVDHWLSEDSMIKPWVNTAYTLKLAMSLLEWYHREFGDYESDYVKQTAALLARYNRNGEVG